MPEMSHFLLCFNYLNAYTIELLIFFTSLLGIANAYFSHLLIPWDVLPWDFELRFKILNIFLFCVILLFLTPIIFLRLKGLINNNCNSNSFYISLVGIVSSCFGVGITIYFNILILKNMNKYELNSKNKIRNKKIPKQDWIKTIILISIISFIWIILLILTISDSLRIEKQTNGSYSSYLSAIKEEKKHYELENRKIGFKRKKNKKNSKKKEKEEIENKKGEINNKVIQTESAIQMNEDAIKEIICNKINVNMINNEEIKN